jgi:hypothetical protein
MSEIPKDYQVGDQISPETVEALGVLCVAMAFGLPAEQINDKLAGELKLIGDNLPRTSITQFNLDGTVISSTPMKR